MNARIKAKYDAIFDAEVKRVIDILCGGGKRSDANKIIRAGIKYDDFFEQACDKALPSDFFDLHRPALEVLFGDKYDEYERIFKDCFKKCIYDNEWTTDIIEQMTSAANLDPHDLDALSGIPLVKMPFCEFSSYASDCVLIKNAYEEAAARGEISPKEIVAYAENNGGNYVLYRVLSGLDEGYDFLYKILRTAGLSDDTRRIVIYYLLTCGNRNNLGRFMRDIKDSGLYKTPAFRDAMYYAYEQDAVTLDLVKKIEIICDVLCGNINKYIGGVGKNIVFYLAVLFSFDKAEYGRIADILLESNRIARRAAMFCIAYISRDKEKYLEKMLSLDLDREDKIIMLSEYDPMRCARFNAEVTKIFLDNLENMPKCGICFAPDKDFDFDRHDNFDELLSELASMYRVTRDAEIIKSVDAVYGKLGADLKIKFIYVFGGVSSLDIRKCSIDFLKHRNNYFINNFLESQKIVLTFEEAVYVSDFLKSKVPSIRENIIKKFLAMPTASKVAEYLAAQKEEYKRAAAEEMKKASIAPPSAESVKIKKTYFDNGFDFKIVRPKEVDDVLSSPPDIRSFTPISKEKASKLIADFTAFINDHAEYEYDSWLYGVKTTLGSKFTLINGKQSNDRDPASFPMGDELYALLRNSLCDDEILTLDAAITAIHESKYKKHYIKLFGDNGIFSELAKIFSSSYRVDNDIAAYALRKMCDLAESGLDMNVRLEFRLLAMQNNARLEDLGLLFSGRDDDREFEFGNIDKKKLLYYTALCATKQDPHFETFSLPTEYFIEFTESGDINYAFAEYLILKDAFYLTSAMNGASKYNYVRCEGKYPVYSAIVKRFVERMVDSELNRGSLPTPYSSLFGAGENKNFFGLDTYFKAAAAIRNYTLRRDTLFGGAADVNISRILKMTLKTPSDGYEKFCELCKRYGITRDELIKITLYNSEYIDYAERYLGIDGLKSAAYWFSAHLNEKFDEEKRDVIGLYSDISPSDFKDGAFDCKWYADIKNRVSNDVLKVIYDNAKYITVAGLHKRAQRFFDAYGGKISKEECIAGIEKSRNKDWVLCYSLIPISGESDLIARYEYLAAFLKSGKQFGAQRRMSEKRTVDIALENLARAAGYADVDLFIYETEAANVCPFFEPTETDKYTVRLVPEKNKVAVKVYENGSEVKIASKLSKLIAPIKECAKTETERLRRVKNGLQKNMTECVRFEKRQVAAVLTHPVMRYLADRLLWLTDGNVLCVPKDDKLVDLSGEPVRFSYVTIPHPITLKKLGLLNSAIDYVAANNVCQPFKQVLREIYEPTDTELTQNSLLRYKGFTVSIKKCVAALKTAGWGYSDDIGMHRVFSGADTVAAIFREFDYFYIDDPDADGRELDSLLFYVRKDGKSISIADVDPVVFSETCRDLDLAVTVCAQNIYDFSLAMSTAEVRKNILISLCGLLHLDNITFLKDNIRIAGKYGTYTVNIRTGLVFKDGVGNLPIDTVVTGEKPILLDFIDEDPVTADIISKAIVLSADDKIADETLLKAVRRA